MLVHKRKKETRDEASETPNRLVRYTSSPSTQLSFEFLREFSSLDAEGRATRVEPVTFDYRAEQIPTSRLGSRFHCASMKAFIDTNI